MSNVASCAKGLYTTIFVPIFQVMIEAVRGNGAKGDIALDDLSMINKKCSEIENGK